MGRLIVGVPGSPRRTGVSAMLFSLMYSAIVLSGAFWVVAVFDPVVVSFDDVDGAVLVCDPQPPMASATAAMATAPALSNDLIRPPGNRKCRPQPTVGKHPA